MMYDKSKKWVHFITRPFNLFEASLWAEWYNSIAYKEIFQIEPTDMLIIEYPKGIARNYRIEQQLHAFWQRTEELVKTQQKDCQKHMEKALQLNKEAEKVLKEKNIIEFKEAVTFLCEVVVYGTSLPYLAYEKINELHIDNKELMNISEKLRATSYYPRLINEIVTPLAKKVLQEKGVKNVDKAIEVVTFKEVIEGDMQQINQRIQEQEKGKYYVYEKIKGKEKISWINNSTKLIEEIEGNDPQCIKEIKGQVACSGKVKGIARIVLKMNKDVVFEKGDILITICSSPDFMPILKRAAGIVADEGGVTSHAAILSRELKIPCIIGTKIATKILKDGDLVEVDAEKGIVRKIK